MVCQNNNKLMKHLLTLSTKQTNTNSNSNTNNQPSHLRIGRSHLNSHSYLDSHSHLNSNGGGVLQVINPNTN